MNNLILIKAKNHIELSVLQSMNSFGSQILIFYYESLEGSRKYSVTAFDEGDWKEFTHDNMLQFWKQSGGLDDMHYYSELCKEVRAII